MKLSALIRFKTPHRLMVLLVLAMLSFGIQASTSTSRVEITAKRFEFSPSEITLKKGVPAVLVFHSEDVDHSIVVKDLNVKADILKRKDAEVQVTPQTTGTFTGNCGHFCGSGHGRMKLTIHVVD